jgi:hypothetical protein
MIVRDFKFNADMPDDMKYLRLPEKTSPFIEYGMIFIIPERLKNFRKNLFYVKKLQNEDSNIYQKLFPIKCITPDDQKHPEYEGPFDVFPFYEKSTLRKRNPRDYYLLFLFRHQADFRRYSHLK